MFDTIHIWLPSERSGKIDLNLFIQNLEKTEEIKSEFGEYKIRGKLRQNLNVLFTSNGISIKGSLAKYFIGNNLKTLTREEIKTAIQKIGNDLSIPILKAKLTRIDIGFNMSMEYEPRYYFNGLGEKSRMHRSIVDPTSLYYKNGSKVLNFYAMTRI